MDILSKFFQPTAFRCIDRSNGVQIWTKLVVEQVEILNDSETAESPVAIKGYTDQTLLVDAKDVNSNNAKIIKPTQFRVKALASDQATVESVMRYLANVESSFDISSKEFTARNVIMSYVTIDQSAKVLSAHELAIEFEQASAVPLAQFDPLQPSDQSNYGTTIQDVSRVSASSLLSNFTSSVESLYNKVSSAIG